MAIMMKAEVVGQTLEGYQHVFDALEPHYKAAPGFIAHLSHPTEGGWCVIDVWTSRGRFESFFREHVAQRLPDTVRPKIGFQELHDVLTADSSESEGSAA